MTTDSATSASHSCCQEPVQHAPREKLTVPRQSHHCDWSVHPQSPTAPPPQPYARAALSANFYGSCPYTFVILESRGNIHQNKINTQTNQRERKTMNDRTLDISAIRCFLVCRQTVQQRTTRAPTSAISQLFVLAFGQRTDGATINITCTNTSYFTVVLCFWSVDTERSDG